MTSLVSAVKQEPFQACSSNGVKACLPALPYADLDTVLYIVHACNFFACPHIDGNNVERQKVACRVSQAAVVQQSCGMRTRNGGGGYLQPAEESQKKKGNKHITMQYLEQGGYFDVPIHVSQTGLPCQACLHCLHCLMHNVGV